MGRADAAGRRRPGPERALRRTAARCSSTADASASAGRPCGSCRCSTGRSRTRRDGFEPVELGSTSVTRRTSPWDEARERELTLDVPPVDGPDLRRSTAAPRPRSCATSDGVVGRLVRTWRAARGAGWSTTVERPESPYAVSLVIRARREPDRHGRRAGPDRPAWLRRALVAAPPAARGRATARSSRCSTRREWAQAASRRRASTTGVFPVLAGPADQDARGAQRRRSSSTTTPSWRRESETAFFDALEVDELLSLRTMTLSEQEKREVRGTDPRDRRRCSSEVDSMPDDLWERLHGTVRYLDSMTRGAARPRSPRRPTNAGRAVVGPGLGRVGRPGARRGAWSATSRCAAAAA